jgi:hypothetical protein
VRIEEMIADPIANLVSYFADRSIDENEQQKLAADNAELQQLLIIDRLKFDSCDTYSGGPLPDTPIAPGFG